MVLARHMRSLERLMEPLNPTSSVWQLVQPTQQKVPLSLLRHSVLHLCLSAHHRVFLSIVYYLLLYHSVVSASVSLCNSITGSLIAFRFHCLTLSHMLLDHASLNSHNHTLPHSHTLLITCTCCYDLTKGTQDKDFSYSFSDSLSHMLFPHYLSATVTLMLLHSTDSTHFPSLSFCWSPSVGQYLRTASEYIETSSGYIETSSEYIETSSEYIETSSEYLRTSSEYIETSSEYIRTASEYI